MRTAGYFLLLSAACHAIGWVLSGFTISFVIPIILFVGLFAGLARNMISAAWLAFICALGSTAFAVAALSGLPVTPAWVFAGIILTNLGAAALLFAQIWAGKPLRD